MNVETCLTPALIHQYDIRNKVVVVVDIFRATSCMVTGLAEGIASIYPVDNPEACFELGKKGYVTAGERGGIKIEGFEIGNSPFEYKNPAYQGKSIAVTTTNGTQALLKSVMAEEVLVGAFLNLTALTTYLADCDKDLVVHCAGWRGTVNLEDTLFAGALIHKLKAEVADDSSSLALEVYQANKSKLVKIGRQSAHARRLAKFGVEEDLVFCMTPDVYDVVPIYQDKEIWLLK